MAPRLIAGQGFLRQGTASILGPQGWVQAQPLTLSGLIYGFTAQVALEPGAPLSWSFEGVDLFGRKLAGRPVSFGRSELWLKVRDGSFETFDIGEEWGTEDARIEATCNPSRLYPYESELPAIAGARSLVIGADGYRDRFRFSRATNQTQLSFVAFGSVSVELATVGAVDGPPLEQQPTVTPADCQTYAAFCAKVPAGTLNHYSVDLPPGDSDVLVRLYNGDTTPSAAAGGSDLCVDDLALQ